MRDTNPRQVDNLEVNEADDGLVVYDANLDAVHYLNSSASMVFDLCDGSRDAQGILNVLKEIYGSSSLSIEEVRSGLSALATRALIRWEPNENQPAD